MCQSRYIRNIQLVGGIVKYVPLSPPPQGARVKASAAEWTLDLMRLRRTITSRTKMIVSGMEVSGRVCRY